MYVCNENVFQRICSNTPSKCNVSSKQFGKKWGKHKTDYPDLSMEQYKNLIGNVFKTPLYNYYWGGFMIIKE